MKSNIGITIFLGIQIVRNHIPKNLDNRSNVDSLAVYGLLSYDKYLSSFSQILIHTRFNNYPTQTDIIELASPQQLKSLNRDVKYRLKLIRNHYTTPETSGQTHVPRQQLNLDFPKALQTSLQPAFSISLAIPTHHPITKRHVTLFSIVPTRYTWQENSRQFFQAQKDLEQRHY